MKGKERERTALVCCVVAWLVGMDGSCAGGGARAPLRSVRHHPINQIRVARGPLPCPGLPAERSGCLSLSAFIPAIRFRSMHMHADAGRTATTPSYALAASCCCCWLLVTRPCVRRPRVVSLRALQIQLPAGQIYLAILPLLLNPVALRPAFTWSPASPSIHDPSTR